MKKFLLGLIAVVLVVGGLAFADMTDKGTLGGQSTTNGVYDWRVTSTGDLVPGTTNQNNVGGTSNKVATVYATNVNATSLSATSITGVNWTGMNIPNNGFNWTDIQAAQANQGLTSGINWYDLNPIAGGINWTTVVKSAADNTILCVKAGQIGKCTASFSASGAGSCTCM